MFRCEDTNAGRTALAGERRDRYLRSKPRSHLRHPYMSTFVQAPPYIPKNKIRIVTAASLFNGHDAAINIMRRIIQSTGAEVIHLGHDRSVEDVVNAVVK